MKSSYKIELIGFNTEDSVKIAKIFQISKSRDRSYQVNALDYKPDADIALVNLDAHYSPALNDFQALNPHASIITYSKNKAAANDSSPHIKGLLLATKIFKVLDNLPNRTKVEQTSDTPPIATQNPLASLTQAPHHKIIAPIKSALSISQEESSKEHFKVLIVDDSELMQKSLALELKKCPQSIAMDFADNGEMALELIHQNHYDFIFLDVMMPGIDGYETCTEIRKIQGMKKTPIIMLSAKTSPLDEVKGVMAGCTSYITKPIQPKEFQKMLARVTKWLTEFNQTQQLNEI